MTTMYHPDDSPICIGLLEDWIGELLKEFGVNLFRYKGVLNCQGSDLRFVFQGGRRWEEVLTVQDDN